MSENTKRGMSGKEQRQGKDKREKKRSRKEKKMYSLFALSRELDGWEKDER